MKSNSGESRGEERAHSPFLPKACLNYGHGLGDEVSQAPRLTSLLLPPVPHCETDSFWFGSVSQTAGDEEQSVSSPAAPPTRAVWRTTSQVACGPRPRRAGLSGARPIIRRRQRSGPPWGRWGVAAQDGYCAGGWAITVLEAAPNLTFPSHTLSQRAASEWRPCSRTEGPSQDGR